MPKKQRARELPDVKLPVKDARMSSIKRKFKPCQAFTSRLSVPVPGEATFSQLFEQVL
jgi:hypothetical protein